MRTVSEYLGPASRSARRPKRLRLSNSPSRRVCDLPFDEQAALRDLTEEAATKSKAAEVYATLGVKPPLPGNPVPIENPTPSVGSLIKSAARVRRRAEGMALDVPP